MNNHLINKNLMRTKLLLLLLSLVLTASVVRAQITLEQTLPNDTYPFNTSQGGTWYAEYALDSVLSVYRSDYSLYKDIQIPMGFNTYVEVYFLSDKLFNSDSKLEYLLKRSTSPTDLEAILVNEDGEILYNFGNADNSYPFVTQRIGMGPALGFRHYNLIESIYVTDIYSLPGVYLPVKEPDVENNQHSFPNPASSFIEIPYKISNPQDAVLSIYTSSGTLTERRLLDINESKLVLNISTLPAGVYIYKYGTVSGKFVVRKK